MDYKKKYKDLLERARKLRDKNCDGRKMCMESLFDELAESEDKEIRQAMINFFKSERIKDGIAVLHFGVNIEKMIAWLEKQAPKSKWSEEDEIGSDETIELLEYFINYAPEFRKPAIGRSVAWLNSLKKRLGGEE